MKRLSMYYYAHILNAMQYIFILIYTKVLITIYNFYCSIYYSDTVTRSGMFCALATTIDRCNTERIVDVFQVLKAQRIQKPGSILTVVSTNT